MARVTLDIRRTVEDTVRLPFAEMADAILPREYQLSLVICGDRLAQSMNAKYRKKTYHPNVLSFPLSKKDGEIFLNIRKAGREAKAMNVPIKDRIARLFVHGCVHLAGLDHGTKMDQMERRILSRFGFRDIPEA